MSKPAYFDAEYPILKDDDVGRAAVEGQIVKTYPQVVRKDVDPFISGQKCGNVSFMLFDQPRIFRDKPVYGFMKLRGNWESQEVCFAESKKLVREVDSKFQIRIAPVGHWVPITEYDGVVKDLIDVPDSDNKEFHLRDEIALQKEKESEKKRNELVEAEKRLREEPDIYDEQESLRFYAMKRVTEKTLAETVQIHQDKLNELKKKLAEQRIILKRLELQNDRYTYQWIGLYNEERAKTSLPPFVPGETQFKEFDELSLQDLLLEYPKFKTPQDDVLFEKYASLQNSKTLSKTDAIGDFMTKSKK
jgi:Family of unknown function (DUF5832)